MKKAYLVAGGTGGHINAAIAVGEALINEGFDVEYITGRRELDFRLLANYKTHHLNAKPLRTKNPILLIKNILNNGLSFFKTILMFLNNKPRFVLGAGGYVCGPTLLAAYVLGIKVYIIEQNAVMGLTNKLLSFISSKIFTHFEATQGLSERYRRRVRVVGNPTRSSISPVPSKAQGEKLNVLIFGGSLGARQINDIVEALVSDPPFNNLSIHHQTGADIKIESDSIDYKGVKYIDDMQKEYEWCDVIISRAGASTISELNIIRKPVLLIPYPYATDNHQYFNAKFFKESSDFSVIVLDSKIELKNALLTVKEFLVKAQNKELKYTQESLEVNDTCKDILREIFEDVGMV